MNFYLKQAADVIAAIRYGTLATITPEGRPWVSPVYIVRDGIRWYWMSDKENQHSKNVRANPWAALVVFDSTVPEGEGRGVYLAGQARELSDRAVVARVRRIKKASAGNPDEFLGKAVRRVYELAPDMAWTNGVQIEHGKFIRDLHVPLDLQQFEQVLAM